MKLDSGTLNEFPAAMPDSNCTYISVRACMAVPAPCRFTKLTCPVFACRSSVHCRPPAAP